MPSLEMNLGLALFKTSQFAEAIKAFSAELKNIPAIRVSPSCWACPITEWAITWSRFPT